MTRPSIDDYFIGFARQAGTRATCDRGKSGAVIVVQGQVVSTGYVGAARGLDHCDDVGHLIRKVEYLDETEFYCPRGACSGCDACTMRQPIREHCMRGVHAEGNAIVQAAKLGNAINGGTLYCKMEPCLRCCGDIINAGIVRVVAEFKYHGAALTREWFEKAGVELVVLNDETATYDKTRKKGLGTANYVICHWDTFDNESMTVGNAPTLKEAVAWVEKEYKGRIRHDGADRVDIVHHGGNIVRQFRVG